MDFLKKVALSFILLQLFLFIPVSIKASEPIGAWTLNSTLVHKIANHSSLSFQNYLYAFGGSTDDDFSYIQQFNTISTDPWSSLPDLPYPTYWHTMVSKSNKIYILGGKQFPGGSLDFVNVADTDSLGNISSWIGLNSLPHRLSKGVAVISGDYIYYAGGWTDVESVGTASNKVYYAHINPDDSLGSWNTTSDLPGVLWDHRIVELNGFLYIVGGWKNGVRTKDVLRAQTNADGSLSAWQNMTDLPTALENFGIARVSNYIIIVAGGSDSGLTQNVYYGQIDASGNIPSWQLSTSSLPSLHCCGALAEVGGFLYLSGGYDGNSYLDTVYKAQFTPNVSPTPPPTTKVLFIPGTGASWNADALLGCKDTGYSGNWELAPFAKGVYSDLLHTLENSGYTVIPYYYDWRKQVTSHNDELGNLIDNSLSGNEKIDLIGHSMGGLVGRSYLQSRTTNSHLDKFIAAGSPFAGAVLAYPGWSAGEILSDDLLFRIGATLLKERCGGVGPAAREALQQHMPFIQNLLPTFDYLEDSATHILKPISSMLAQNNWLPNNFSTPFFGVKVGTLSGNAQPTIYRLQIKSPTNLDNLLGNWQDGHPTQLLKTNAGDGTVLTSSSSLPHAMNTTIDQTHVGLVNSHEGINKILHFLGPSSAANLALVPTAGLNSALLIMSDTNDFSVNINGSQTNSQDKIVSVINPGKLNITFSNDSQTSGNIIVAQFLINGQNLWKEYPAKGHLKKRVNINFDPNGSSDDILKWSN